MDEIWTRYKAGEEHLENDLVGHYIPKARQHARQAMARAPQHQDYGELLSYALTGLLDAVRKFEPGQGVKFETYAKHRIVGSIKDYLRKMDPLTRSSRSSVSEMREVQKVLQLSLGRPATLEEIAAALEVDEADVRRRIMQQRTMTVSLDHAIEDASSADEHFSSGHVLSHFQTDSDAIETAVEVEDVAERLSTELAHRLSGLSTRDRLFVLLYYAEANKLERIGRMFGVNGSRVAQIRREMVKSLLGHVKLEDRMLASVGFQPVTHGNPNPATMTYMATVTQKVCDVNPRHGARVTITAAVENRRYEIEVCNRDARHVEKTMRELGFRQVKAAVGGNLREIYQAASGAMFSASQVRAWAAENDMAVSDRGVIPKQIMTAYAESH